MYCQCYYRRLQLILNRGSLSIVVFSIINILFSYLSVLLQHKVITLVSLVKALSFL